jgi:hypothetical protein
LNKIFPKFTASELEENSKDVLQVVYLSNTFDYLVNMCSSVLKHEMDEWSCFTQNVNQPRYFKKLHHIVQEIREIHHRMIQKSKGAVIFSDNIEERIQSIVKYGDHQLDFAFF